MFIKKSWFVKNGKRYITYQIAHSYRPPKSKHPKTRILATITHLGKPLIDKIALLLKSPNSYVISDLSSFFKESYVFGPILFLYLLMKKMGLIDCLRIIPKKARFLLIAVIMNRILEPKSKLGTISWIKKTIFPILFGVKSDKLIVNEVYRAMDILYKRLDKVLGNFFIQNKTNTILLLYDITSIFFEGKGPEEIAKFGYSRDKRPDNPQILLSLVLNEEKLPVYFDILAGNTLDKKTVIPLIKKLKERYDLSQSIFIGDRGMVTIENIEFLEENGIGYIVALTHREARQLIISKSIQLELFDHQIPVTLCVEENEKTRRRYVLCGSDYRKEHDRKVLEHILLKGKEALEKVVRMVELGKIKDYDKVIRRAQKKLTQSGCENFYDFRYKHGRLEIIEKKDSIEKAKALCGYYLLKTTIENMEDKEIEAHYKGLKFVEDAFRQLKDLVEIRPIFHWENRRVRTHIFLCILAQTVINKIKDVLKKKGWLNKEKENSISSFIDKLYQVNLGIFEIERVDTPIITQLTQEQKGLLSLFDMEEKCFNNFNEAKKVVD